MNAGSMDDASRRRCLIQDKRRLADVNEKHERVRGLLQSVGCDAVLLQDPANVAWFTAGADLTRCASDSGQTSVFVTEDARLFATNAVDSAQLFEREAFGLGFQLKQREWFQPHSELVEDLCRGRKIISDCGFEGTKNAGAQIGRLRLPLTDLEVDRLRTLSKVLVHAVEVTAGHIRKGVTEAAVAGELGNRLLRRTVVPVRIQVCADGRNIRYRHWSFGEDPIESYATVSCVARRWGLHVAVSRTVCLDVIQPELRKAHQNAVLMHATGIYFSRHATMLKDLWPKVKRIYDKFGLESEWQLCDQADIIGYRTSEHQLTPTSEFELQAPTPVFWHPCAGAAMPGDTVLVMPAGCEVITRSSAWPKLSVEVKGHEMPCAGLLLIRDSQHQSSKKAARSQSESPILTGNLPDDDADHSRMDSIWELDLTSGRSVFEERESRYSEESVLD